MSLSAGHAPRLIRSAREGLVKRLIWLAVAAVIVVAVVLAWPKLEEARLSRELAAIEVTQDPAERTDELKTFILDNATAPESVLGEALEMAASSAQAAGGVDAALRRSTTVS
jgi:hypothetical protein